MHMTDMQLLSSWSFLFLYHFPVFYTIEFLKLDLRKTESCRVRARGPIQIRSSSRLQSCFVQDVTRDGKSAAVMFLPTPDDVLENRKPYSIFITQLETAIQFYASLIHLRSFAPSRRPRAR